MTDQRILRSAPLQPATVHEFDGGKPPYAPRIPWRWIALGFVGIVLPLAVYGYRHHLAKEDLRARILRLRSANVEPLTTRYREIQQLLARWSASLADELKDAGSGMLGETGEFAHANLLIDELSEGRGLYLRMRLSEAESAPKDDRAAEEDVAKAAARTKLDGLVRCLGLSPTSVRSLYERGRLLETSWLENVHDARGMLRLRVLNDELERAIQRDLPVIADLINYDWALVVVDDDRQSQGDRRRIGIWDIKRELKLLDAVWAGKPRVVTARNQVGDSRQRPAPFVPISPDDLDLSDCSAAAHVRELANRGQPLPED